MTDRITYNGLAIPTTYRGRIYRSRLEAKWAAFFDRLGWKYEYEPEDFGFWSPDFAIFGANGPIYAEVKPITEFHLDTALRMAQLPGEHLLLGMAPFPSPDTAWMGSDLALGWFVNQGLKQSGAESTTGYSELEGEPGGPVAIIGVRGPQSRTSIGLACSILSYRDRISGAYEGDGHLAELPPGTIERLWSEATNAVQWKGPRR